jgi:hypothetical protein
MVPSLALSQSTVIALSLHNSSSVRRNNTSTAPQSTVKIPDLFVVVLAAEADTCRADPLCHHCGTCPWQVVQVGNDPQAATSKLDVRGVDQMLADNGHSLIAGQELFSSLFATSNQVPEHSCSFCLNVHVGCLTKQGSTSRNTVFVRQEHGVKQG